MLDIDVKGTTHSMDKDRIFPPLPLGTSTFSALRLNGEIYVDKTRLIYSLCSKPGKVFLARPRRFGKSLLVSTFHSLFKYGVREFSGLAIESVWHERRYPVVWLDFSELGSCDSPHDFETEFRRLVCENFADAGYEGEPDWLQFSRWLAGQPMRSIVLLIDEYDAPLTACLNDPALFEEIQNILGKFFRTLKSKEGALRFFFMTGITKFADTGIFPGFNDLQDTTLDPQYGALLGYTEKEIRDSFSSHLSRAADVLKRTEQSIVEELRLRYNGFCFDEEASVRVFCPWSVLNFFNQPARGFQNYWYRSGGRPAVLMEYLRSHPLGNPASYGRPQPLMLSALEASNTLNDLPLVSLLVQTGYLTIKERALEGLLVVGYPNREVSDSMAQLYADELLRGADRLAIGLPGIEGTLANGSLEEVVSLFNRVFSAIDYDRYPIRDEASCRAFLQVLLIGAAMMPEVEVHNAHGRSDLEVEAGPRRWIFEIKFARSESHTQKLLAEGVAQLKARRYGEAAPLLSGVGVKSAVLVFSGEKRRFTASTAVS